jgi:hypothetical protein
MALPFIDEAIAQFNCRTDPFDTFDVRPQLLGALQNIQLATSDQRELEAEIAAFTFRFTYQDVSPWGTTFAPLQSEPREDGTIAQNPDLKRLDSASLEIWVRRARTCTNPVLTSRYADLVWDMEQKITGKTKRRPEFARIAFAAYLRAVSEGRFRFPPSSAQALKRALEIAGEMHDGERISQATDAILEFTKSAPAGLLPALSKESLHKFHFHSLFV